MLVNYPRFIPSQKLFLQRRGLQKAVETIPQLAVWAVSDKDIETIAFLQKLKNSCSLHGRQNPHSHNYECLLGKWACWYLEWSCDPILGPIADVANFIADLDSFQLDRCRYKSEGVAFLSSALAKQSSQGKILREFFFPFFPHVVQWKPCGNMRSLQLPFEQVILTGNQKAL